MGKQCSLGEIKIDEGGLFKEGFASWYMGVDGGGVEVFEGDEEEIKKRAGVPLRARPPGAKPERRCLWEQARKAACLSIYLDEFPLKKVPNKSLFENKLPSNTTCGLRDSIFLWREEDYIGFENVKGGFALQGLFSLSLGASSSFNFNRNLPKG
jgi:hypothetical protein